ncbi:hypothetical protein [Nocardioides sp.]|uniref:DUF7311 family protein n=1 Tax=Nocardioides sp. TaxID=35761 RepID=UPI002733DD6F|nr:hypothetical protein [Nocardioides sp.]MDP3891215.1 hypothetical protein [Nocardioides sp.]
MIKRTCAVVTTTALLAAALTAVSGPATADDAGDARAAQAVKRFTVTIASNTTELVSGKKLVIKGKVTPKRKAKRKVVVLQKRMAPGKPWKVEAKKKTNRKGGYKFTDKPGSMKPREYRVVKPASGKLKKGTSPRISVTIYRWQDLTKLKVRQAMSTWRVPKTSINAVEYGPALNGNRYAASGFIDYNLERQCLRVKARFGQSDDADATAVASIDVIADGVSLFTGDFALTQSVPRTLPLNKAFRLGFHWTSTNPEDPEDKGSVPTIAAPQVLCSF